MSTLAIVEAFKDLPDPRRGAGRHHGQALRLALFILAVSAGCRKANERQALVEREEIVG